MSRALTVLALALALPASATNHSGDVAGTWLASDSPHRVFGVASVPAGQILVVEPGCLVVFDAAALLRVDGTLSAEGTSLAPIAFASMGAGSPGEWKGLVLTGAGPHRLAFAELNAATTGIAVSEYATLLMNACAVTGSSGDGVTFSRNARGTIAGSTFAGNGGAGVAMRDASPVLTACRFTGNARAAWVSGASYPNLSNLTAVANDEGDGILIDTLQPVTGFGAWRNGGIPWIVPDGGTMTVGSTCSLALFPGVNLKLGAAARIVVDGFMSSQSDGLERCRITSLRDDTAGGDTNGDGSATVPSKGDWDAIEVSAGAQIRLVGTSVSHADDAVRGLGGEAILWDCDIRNATNRGAVFGPLAAAFILGTSFTDCDTGLEVASALNVIAGLPGGGQGAGGQNTFGCNQSFDVVNTDSRTLLVHESYFGPGGPDYTMISGDVDAGVGLSSESTQIDRRRPLLLSRPNPSEVGFRWEETGSCATYTLGVSENPDGPFFTFDRPATGEVSAPLTALPAVSLLFFTLDVEL